MRKNIIQKLINYKGRDLRENQEVEVYRNLHNGGFSIRDKKTKLVVAHAPEVHLYDVVTFINEKDRQRVIVEKRKNVHAYLVGKFTHKDFEKDGYKIMCYNPYVCSDFLDEETNEVVNKASSILCTGKVAYYQT